MKLLHFETLIVSEVVADESWGGGVCGGTGGPKWRMGP